MDLDINDRNHLPGKHTSHLLDEGKKLKPTTTNPATPTACTPQDLHKNSKLKYREQTVRMGRARAGHKQQTPNIQAKVKCSISGLDFIRIHDIIRSKGFESCLHILTLPSSNYFIA